MGNRRLESCSASLTVRETQINTRRQHLAPVITGSPRKRRESARMWRKGNPGARLVGTQTRAAPVENGVDEPQKIKNRTTM